MKQGVYLVLGSTLLAVSWFLWSFTLTDPNLYYSSTSVWVSFQQFLWQTPKVYIAWWYLGNVTLSFVLYFHVLHTILRHSGEYTGVLRMTKKGLVLLSIVFGLLSVSNNALSHDLYNYMFNSKAVYVYKADPHVQSALQIAPEDEWLRFMHNVHTEAPYGRFWTFFSLPPSLLGMGKFLPTYISFKAFMAAGIVLLTCVQWRMLKQKEKILLFIFNPLVLVETLLNGHNDVWMMAMALASFYLFFKRKYILSFILLLLSTQIKLATILLIPLWLLLFLSTQLEKRSSLYKWTSSITRMVNTYWADAAALLMFLPLLTDRSQQFRPWYLIWSLSFLPFLRSSVLRAALIAFSVSSGLRYIPFLLVGEYSDAIQLQMRIVTWSALPAAAGWWCIARKRIAPNTV